MTFRSTEIARLRSDRALRAARRVLTTTKMEATMTSLRFAQFMATPGGRFARALLGAALLGTGFFVDGPAGLALAAIGVVPLAAGVFNVCFIAPLLHVPFRAAKLAAR